MHRAPWVPCTKCQWYRDIFTRVKSRLPCSFCSHASKDKPLSNNMLTVIRFRVGYVHLSLILIKKKSKCHKEVEKTYLGMTMRSIGFQNFQQCCFRLPDWWSNSTHWMGPLFLAIFSLHWRHNEPDGVSNHQSHDCLLNRLFRRRSKKTSKLPRHWLLWGEFTDDRWTTKGQWRGKCFHLMTSSCDDSPWFLLPHDSSCRPFP